MIELRPYQKAAVDAVFTYWSKGGGHPLIEIPTGGGKSAVLGEICRRLGEYNAKVIVATHRKELLLQDEQAIRRLWPGAPVGVYSAGLHRHERCQVTVAGVQSVFKRPKAFGYIDVLIVDEAHLVSPKANGQYGKLIQGLRWANRDLRLVGLTATPYRLGQGLLTQGKDRLFDSIVYRANVKDLIDQGYLSPLISSATTGKVDTSTVKVSQGDFVAKDLELAANVSEVTDAVVRDVQYSGRRHVLVFGVGVEHAAHLRNAFRMAGMSAETVTGQTPPAERHRILEAFKAGSLQVLSSCDVLTTGFDAPLVDCLAIVRPTMSPGLYVQMVGRGARIAPGKQNCLILDYGGNIARHGSIDQIEPRVAAKKEAGAAEKLCPSCFAEIPVAKRHCPHCGHDFPAPTREERKANMEASKLSVVGAEKKQKIVAVSQRVVIDYVSARSQKRMLRVDYFEEGRATPAASEYVCIEHDGYARTKAEHWWDRHTGGFACPTTVDQAMGMLDYLRPVRAVKIVKDGQYSRVAGWVFDKIKEGADDDDDIGNDNRGAQDELPF